MQRRGGPAASGTAVDLSPARETVLADNTWGSGGGGGGGGGSGPVGEEKGT